MPRYTSKNAMIVADVFVDPVMVSTLMAHLISQLGPAKMFGFTQNVVDPWIRERISDRFDSEGDDVSGAWAALMPSTEVIRASSGFPPAHPINQRTHSMRNWLVGQDGESKATGIGVEYIHPKPTNDPTMNQKVKTAQSGKSYPNTQPRPVLGVNEADNAYIQAALVLHLLSGL